MYINKKSFLNFILVFCFFAKISSFENDFEKFPESFVNYYDFSTVGRYTHEYHPFLFKKSSYSLDELEKTLVDNGLPIRGRLVLTGYEEQAIPAYYTNYKVCTGSKINDEAWSKGKSGWTQQLHNKFGVMTGFLFRNLGIINEYQKYRHKEKLFEHINLHTMPIYNNRSYIFQRHAFDGMLPIMQGMQEVIEDSVLKRDQKMVFDGLIKFWEKLYEYELKFGNRKVLGTQDILFSVAHAQHLFRSNVPLFKYYFGPDITYPIKVTRLQKEAATYNSQAFVKKFVKNLKPIDDKSTVYIFCSFVDGVGKSTLLGNVQNHKKYGLNFVDYDPVDNSSSQLAQLYKYDEKVFIADLPAQMSHFTYKPDGMVYFDILACGMTDEQIFDLYKFVNKNKEDFIKNYEDLIDKIKKEKEDGKFEKFIKEDGSPSREFVKNLFLLKKIDRNDWIPFSHEGEFYLFDKNNPSRIRKLVKLELADSLGLKNYEAEQMLFYEGVRFPLPYKEFVNDLISQLKERDIEQVVFVNFLSMYPRSSRENIRVNYLLQQLSLLHEDFSLEDSLYAPYVSDAHLLYKLKKDKYGDVLNAFQQEVLARLSLYNIMSDEKLRTVEGIKLDRVSKLLEKKVKSVPDDIIKLVGDLTREKIKQEKKSLKAIHGKTKDYINIQELEFDDVIEFCEKLQEYIYCYVDNDRISDLWMEPGEILGVHKDQRARVDKIVRLSDGTWAELLFVIQPNCKDKSILAPVVRFIRASWYAALGNIIGGESAGTSKSIKVKEERFKVPPLWVMKTEDGKVAVFRREFEIVDEKITEIPDDDKKVIDNLNVPKSINLRWGEYKEKFYLLSLERAQTDSKFFAFGCDLFNYDMNGWPGFDFELTYFVRKFKEKNKPEIAMTAKKLWEKLEEDFFWPKSFKRVVKKAKKNSEKKEKKEEIEKEIKGFVEEEKELSESEKKLKTKKSSIKLGRPEQIESSRFIVRALATLEMIIKDPNSEISVRRGNRDDFVAALKLIEKIVLPTYFNIIFEEDLFDDYHSVRPLIVIDGF